ncbi:chemotaxis protein CheA [Pseudobacteriovorax antillogorgiicola]|uniref:histidine kinase n=1 Tax=Pseudobacteriovorax antillogorgiicola TaxID=1513793 RepID=A0A1Y6BC51_9BACT|nr:ATP-binding protein [Pseudobacteriovorax antillogorgiicola]TCS57499.1 Hpt domain-containing protein [Pseudobacteriovorax antillogorgiicola]SMF00362.1 Hpt domain-containing protein [Pseudobacteriovorax antillogorgiicola]
MIKDLQELELHREFLGEQYEEMLQNFQSEVYDLIKDLQMMFFEKDHYPSTEDLNLAMRILHTLKGTTAQFKLKKTSKFIHSIEDIFCAIRDQKQEFNSGTYQTLVPFLNCLRTLVEVMGPDILKAEAFQSQLRALAFYHQAFLRLYDKEHQAYSPKGKPKNRTNYRGLLDFVEKADLSSNKRDQGNRKQHTYGIREQDLDSLTSNLCQALFTLTDRRSGHRHQVLQLLEQSIVTLQSSRQVSLAPLATKSESLLVDLANRLRKKVCTKVSGMSEVNIDITWFQILSDCMTHLCRNAIDHGIEMPEDRLEKGKPETGAVRIAVEQRSGRIVVTFEEDGKGLHGNQIAARAVEKGVISQTELEQLNFYERQALIFHPGFSSNDTVTDLSGRGVGMDVVRSQVENAGGSVYFDSEVDQYTRFEINIPIAFFEEEAVLFRYGQQVYSLSKACIVDCYYPDRSRVDMGALETDNGDIYTLLHLKDIDHSTAMFEKQCYLALDLGGTPVAIGVDELLGTFDLFFFPMEELQRKIPYLGSVAYSKDYGAVLAIDRFYLHQGLNNFLFDDDDMRGNQSEFESHQKAGEMSQVPIARLEESFQDQDYLNHILAEARKACPELPVSQLIVPLSETIDEMLAKLAHFGTQTVDLATWNSWKSGHLEDLSSVHAKLFNVIEDDLMNQISSSKAAA